MSLFVDIQVDVSDNTSKLPTNNQIIEWVKNALSNDDEQELTVRLCNIDEIAELNQTYRQKSGPTNVLSFPAELPDELKLPLLGDIVISAAVVEKEANEQKKLLEAHWAHMVVHGVLHLLGYDHINDDEAKIMEEQEIEILQRIGYENPYSTMDKI